jgi:diguanylate cyclase (GGDEF)-like protein
VVILTMHKSETRIFDHTLNRILYVIFAFFAVVLVGLMYYIPFAVQNFAIVEAVNDAEGTSKQLVALREYYTTHIIKKIEKSTQFKVDSNHKGKDNVIPLPATMIRDLSVEFEKLGASIDLYSPYPFLGQNKRNLTAFELDAWDSLSANPDAPYIRTETLQGKLIVTVAIADKMTSQSCVQCHNSHPNSPKRDWNVGDVRGVLEINKNISQFIRHGEIVSYRVISVLVGLLVLVVSSTYLLSRQWKTEKETEYLATHDNLTGLSNRLVLDSRIELAVNSLRRNSTVSALLFIDLDGFKQVNDKHGHAAGDHILKTTAERLQLFIRSNDTIARIGGDEFVVLMMDIDNYDDVEKKAKKIIAAVSNKTEFGNRILQVGCSIGVVIIQNKKDEHDGILERADHAMYQAKAAGKGTVVFYSG